MFIQAETLRTVYPQSHHYRSAVHVLQYMCCAIAGDLKGPHVPNWNYLQV